MQEISEKKSTIRPSELRQDLVCGDWVTIATGRAKRPNAYARKQKFIHDPVRTCPFDNLEKFGNEDPVLICGNKGAKSGKWTLKVVPNKYPAFTTEGANTCPVTLPQGPHRMMEGMGFHEVFVYRDHKKSLAELPLSRVEEVIGAYASRYRSLKNEGCVNYISIFHNHGREAGASLTHPHSQLVAIPVIPPDIARSLDGSQRYFAEKQKCIHCVMLEFEQAEKSRIVFENTAMIVLAPYASHTAFELRIFPKTHNPHFEDITAVEERYAAVALQAALKKIFKGLKNPPYNFYIHTAPPKGHGHDNYHWHLEIVPKTQVWAGFEIGTGIEISSIAPEEAAKFLRSIK